MSQLPDLPVPITSERDNDGRLVGLAFDSVPPPATPETNPWLVAVDGSDSALRAVHKCSPLKNLPIDKYGSWRAMELNFDPQDLL